MIPPHLIEKAWELFQFHSAGNGVEPEKLHYLAGVASCMGILTGALDLGIPEGTKTFDVMVQLQAELDKYRAEITALEDQARRRTERRNRV